MREIKSFSFPVVLVLFAIYCIVQGASESWMMWAFIAFLVDALINPLYESREEKIENGKDKSYSTSEK